MAEPKKKRARLVLRGVSVLGILVGAGCIVLAISIVLALRGGDSGGLWLGLPFAAMVLVLGAWLARDCYLMLTVKSFGAVKYTAAILAFLVDVVLWPLASPLEALLVGRNMGAFADELVEILGLLSFLFAYSMFSKALARLVEAGYAPEGDSEARRVFGGPPSDG